MSHVLKCEEKYKEISFSARPISVPFGRIGDVPDGTDIGRPILFQIGPRLVPLIFFHRLHCRMAKKDSVGSHVLECVEKYKEI